MSSWSGITYVAVVGSLVFFLTGCGRTPPPPAPPPPEVTVSRPLDQPVTTYLEYNGTTMALESVEIRARVAGYLESMHFEPRARVNASDVLFLIDPKQYRARVQQAEGAVEAAKAGLRIREIELHKYSALGSKEVIAELKVDDVRANRDMALAELERAKANLDTAKLDLEYTNVRSPIRGRVSRNLVDLGNLVGATENTLLANVVNDDWIYVYFNLSELDLLKLVRKAVSKNGDKTPQERETRVEMGLADEKGYPHVGRFDYTDIKVDPSTGTIQVRGVFPNRDGVLYPGMFARIRVPVETHNALLIPDSAIMTDQGGKFALVCNAENTVEFKRVVVGIPDKDLRVIVSGLTPQDNVIVNGLQKARPGAKVTPVEAPLTAKTNGSMSASGS